MYKRLFMFAAGLLSLLPVQVLAAGGPVENIVIVADSRKLEGIMAWWANVYNESHAEFTLITVLIIPVIGVIFGILADIIMGWIGLDLSSKEVHH